MKVLWFSNTPSNYLNGINPYNGGGWISSLETALTKDGRIQLAIAFILDDQPSKVIRDNIVYYPIEDIYTNSIARKGKSLLVSREKNNEKIVSHCLKIIEDYHPNIIEVFGTEGPFGLISCCVKVPVLIHIQGLLNPCLNAFFPPNVSKTSFVFSDYNPIKIRRRILGFNHFRSNGFRELAIIKSAKYFVGRTEWDKRIVSLFNPVAHYFECGEILRDAFYGPSERKIPSKLTIVSTISSPLYKGGDWVLKTAEILKNELGMDFEWKLYGNVDLSFVEKTYKIKHENVNVNICGVVSAETLKDALLNCTCYVHPSYIDNSPNSVCEAQILGCPVIATYVGGIPSLIENGKTGYLIPANDPFQLAYLIRLLYSNLEINKRIGANTKTMAELRHQKKDIVENLIRIYNHILLSHGTW